MSPELAYLLYNITTRAGWGRHEIVHEGQGLILSAAPVTLITVHVSGGYPRAFHICFFVLSLKLTQKFVLWAAGVDCDLLTNLLIHSFKHVWVQSPTSLPTKYHSDLPLPLHVDQLGFDPILQDMHVASYQITEPYRTLLCSSPVSSLHIQRSS